MDLKKKLREKKDKFNDLNEQSIKLQQDIQMMQQALQQNEMSRVETSAQINLIEEMIKEGGK
jgi:septal ring factor EnvC (AmiA/AmiB activator)